MEVKLASQSRLKRIFKRILRILVLGAAGFYGLCFLGFIYLKFFPPLTTTVQIQRWVESWNDDTDYTWRYTFVPLSEIDDDLEHAVVAAEDGRFREHWGIDWDAIQDAIEDNRDGRRRRGGSTITQQLVKNLYLTTHSRIWRKALELPLTIMAELILSKDRILELYLNVIEWGPGVYGSEAAAQYHYRTSAARLNRDQAARLAACIPAPRSRRPHFMNRYSRIILMRMRQMGY